jgi:hypothetical protein
MWSIAGVACVSSRNERWIYHLLPITKYGSLSPP